MNMKDWLHSENPNQREKLAKMAGTKIAYLWQIAGGHSLPSWRLAVRIENASCAVTPNKIIKSYELRPDIAKAFKQNT